MRRHAAPLALAAGVALVGCAAGVSAAALSGSSAPDRRDRAGVTGNAPAPPSPLPLTVQVEESDTLGRVLADLQGRTLYRYDLDTPATITCTGECTDTRKPLLDHRGDVLRLPPGITGKLADVPRPDGTRQVTDDGAPLYWFTGDQQPGDVFGDGGHWHVIQVHNLPLP